MYVQVVSYGLTGMDEGEYFDVANDVAPRFAGMPGLLAKLWLGNAEEGRYGAVYLWEDRESMERFVHSDLFEVFNPEFAEVAVEDFDVLENLTAVTQPVLQVLEPRRRAPVRPPAPTPVRGAVGPSKAPATSKAATKAKKKAAKTTVTTAKKAGPMAKGAGLAKKAGAGKKAGVAKKAATRAATKTAKRPR